MLSQHVHGYSPWIWKQSGWTLGANCWAWMQERWWGTDPRCCLSVQEQRTHRHFLHAWAACDRKRWRNIPSIFLPVTLKSANFPWILLHKWLSYLNYLQQQKAVYESFNGICSQKRGTWKDAGAGYYPVTTAESTENSMCTQRNPLASSSLTSARCASRAILCTVFPSPISSARIPLIPCREKKTKKKINLSMSFIKTKTQ